METGCKNNDIALQSPFTGSYNFVFLLIDMGNPEKNTAVEKWQLQRTLEEVDCLDPFQSGFRPGYRTEIALIAQLDDLWQEQDGCGCVHCMISGRNRIEVVHPSLLFLTSHGFRYQWTVSFWTGSRSRGWKTWCCTVSLPSSRIGFGVDRGEEIQATDPTSWGATKLNTLSTPV